MAHFAVRLDFPEYLQDKLNIINNGIILRGIAVWHRMAEVMLERFSSVNRTRDT